MVRYRDASTTSTNLIIRQRLAEADSVLLAIHEICEHKRGPIAQGIMICIAVARMQLDRAGELLEDDSISSNNERSK